MTNRQHTMDFIELPTLDVAAAKAFYGRVFGWTFKDYGPDYADIHGAGVRGGLRRVHTPPPRGGALVVLYAADLAATERAVTAAGGAIMERHEFPGGRRFHFLDASGLELAVWTEA